MSKRVAPPEMQEPLAESSSGLRTPNVARRCCICELFGRFLRGTTSECMSDAPVTAQMRVAVRARLLNRGGTAEVWPSPLAGVGVFLLLRS
jgi:hypothetical protein